MSDDDEDREGVETGVRGAVARWSEQRVRGEGLTESGVSASLGSKGYEEMVEVTGSGGVQLRDQDDRQG